ncbi:MAG: hypothetical protein MUP58_01985 [Candidatus Nanohaloarchaeota archaeon QJJ-9]|nr:hypothetical protein [Candidatus Nanohaloarchaeota archaeon QJJ-9]
MEELEINAEVRGDYKSADLFLMPKPVYYADLLEKVFDEFGEDEVELVIEESSMPLTYYEALDIPLDVFEEKYEIGDEEEVAKDKAVKLARDLLSLGLFDIGFRGDKVATNISHDGYINVKPLNVEKEVFREKVESIGAIDEEEREEK